MVFRLLKENARGRIKMNVLRNSTEIKFRSVLLSPYNKTHFDFRLIRFIYSSFKYMSTDIFLFAEWTINDSRKRIYCNTIERVWSIYIYTHK